VSKKKMSYIIEKGQYVVVKYCPPYTLWGVWDGFAIPVAWCGQESKVRATEYQEAVYKSARTTLAQRSPDRSNAYENLLRVRLNDLAARMAKQRRRGRPVVPLDLFDESENFFLVHCAGAAAAARRRTAQRR
jgi:hypothetical protein